MMELGSEGKEADEEEPVQIDGSAPEACWQLFAFPMHANSHAVIRLQYHLPNMQSTLFNEDASLDSVLETESRTMLTEFFELCKMNEEAKNSLYIHITKQFWWDKSLRIWKKRQRLQHKTICRLYASNPSQGERYYLRLLLTVVKGPTSFEDVCSYEDNTYETFQ